ncbi:MAG: hypothetical protein ACPGVN_02770 [Alphaproteobacteria bacterium]
MTIKSALNCYTRHFAALALCFVFLPSQASAITVNEMKKHLSINIGQNLPITILGPLVSSEIFKQDGVFSIVLPNAAVVDGSPLGDISFQMTEISETTFQVSNVKLPQQLITPEGEILPIKEHSLSGVWSTKNGAYDSVSYKIAGFSALDKDSEFTFSHLGFDLSPQAENGDQNLSIDIGPLAFNNTKENTKLVFDGAKVKAAVNSTETLRVHKVLADMVTTLSETGTEILVDQRSLMQLMSPLQVAYDSASLEISTGRIQFEQPDLNTSLTMKGIDFKSNAADMTGDMIGKSQFELTLSDLNLKDRDNRVEFEEFNWIGATDKVDGNHAFVFGKKLLKNVMDEEAEIDLADAFNLYFNFNDFGMEVAIKGLLASTGNGQSIEIERGSFSGAINDARTDQASLTFLAKHGEIVIPDINNELLLSLKPDDTNIKFGLSGIAAAGIRQAMVGKTVPISLISGDDKALGEFMRNIGFELLNVILAQPPKIFVEDSHVNTPTIKAGLEGSFDISPLAKFIATGTLNVTAEGLKELQQAASKAMGTSKGRTRKIALGMVGGLGLAQGFGKRQKDGSLLYALSVDEAGKVAVNGLPIPKF